MQAAGVLPVRDNRRKREVAVASHLHPVIEEESHVAFALHVFQVPEKLDKGILRNAFRPTNVPYPQGIQHDPLSKVLPGKTPDFRPGFKAAPEFRGELRVVIVHDALPLPFGKKLKIKGFEKFRFSRFGFPGKVIPEFAFGKNRFKACQAAHFV